MRILVTGGAGFIGSHLSDRLLLDGHEIVAVDDLSLGRRENVEHLADHPGFALHVLDVNSDAFLTLCLEGKFDCVFHLCANSDIQAGSQDRTVDLHRTFMTTFSVCEAMAQAGIKQLAFASTSAIYGDRPEPLHENFGPLEPISFYGASKLASEAYACAYAHRHGIQTWIYRFPNVIGGRATHGVIYDFIRKLQSTPDELQVLGDGTQEKPYVYVHDLIDAMALAWTTASPDPVGVWNIGPETSTTVRTIAELVVARVEGSESARIVFGSEPIGWPGDVPKFQYDSSRIRALGWQPRHTSDEAVAQAVDVIYQELCT